MIYLHLFISASIPQPAPWQDLLQLHPWPLHRVVGGASEGLVVRHAAALTSPVLGRLACGALVEERERVKERIRGPVGRHLGMYYNIYIDGEYYNKYGFIYHIHHLYIYIYMYIHLYIIFTIYQWMFG